MDFMENIINQIPLSLIFKKYPLPVHIYFKNIKGVYLVSNDIQAKSLGLSSGKELIGKTDFELHCNKENAKAFRNHDLEVMQTGMMKIVEEKATVAGKPAIVLSQKLPLKSKEGKVLGVFGISVDITDRKKLEEELNIAEAKSEEFNKLKSQFIANMQHDLRTPASGVMQTLSFLCSKRYDPETMKMLKLALGASEELMMLLNQIVDCSKQDYSNPILDKPIKLSTIFESIHRADAPSAAIKHLKFHYHIDSKIPTVVISDKHRLERILLNLVGNAIKFTKAGEVFFEATLVKEEGRDLLIELIVRDTGIGISDDEKNIIFERFVRLNASNRGIYKGIGLGLTNVREYVRDLEGEFRPIDSTPSKGTTFSILIPMRTSLDQGMTLPAID